MTDFETVKSSVDLVAYIESRGIALKKVGRLYKACCPMHPEKTPSFTVDPETQQWRCYGACGTGGDVFEFVEQYDKFNTGEALRIVAEYAHIDLGKHEEPHKRLYELLEMAAQHYTRMLHMATENARAAYNYLIETRKLSPQIIGVEGARIGYAPHSVIRPILANHGYTEKEMLDAGILAKADDGRLYEAFRNRIMIPIFDQQGRVIGFNGRAMGNDQPKYKNSPETPIFKKSKTLYTLREKNTQGRVLDGVQVKTIVEGPFDVLSGVMRGFRGLYAQMGSALSVDQLTQLAKNGTERIIFCFDNDDAGENMMHRLAKEHVHTAARLGVDLQIMRPPHGKDADDTFREKPELWTEAVNAARPAVDVLIDLELASLPQNANAVDKTKAALDLMPTLRSDNPMVQQENIGKLASRLNVTPAEMERWASPKMAIHQPPPAPKQETLGAPTSEEWVLHGILCNEFDDWLARANACLFIASHAPMPYALAPLALEDFADRDTRRLMDLILKSQVARESFADYLGEHVERGLQATYKRVVDLDDIGKEFLMPFNYDIFVHYVCEVRITRLSREHIAFEGKDAAKARECSRAIACLRLSQQDLIDA